MPGIGDSSHGIGDQRQNARLIPDFEHLERGPFKHPQVALNPDIECFCNVVVIIVIITIIITITKLSNLIGYQLP